MVTILEYKKSTIDHDIYIKVFDDGIVSYLTVSTDDVLSTTNNENSFPELTRVFKEHFDMKVQEGSLLKYSNFLIYSLLLVSVLIRQITSWNYSMNGYQLESFEMLIHLFGQTVQ